MSRPRNPEEPKLASNADMKKMLRRFLRTTDGPWHARHEATQAVITARRAANPIAFVPDSVATNAEFIAHSWEDTRVLLGTVMFLRAVLEKVAEGIKQSPMSEADGPKGPEMVYVCGHSTEFVKFIESVAKN